VERLVLVHGSVTGGRMTWAAQRRGLRNRFDLVVLERPGFPPNPPVEQVDFEVDAEVVCAALDPPAHLVGHSYGGVVSLLAAGRCPERVLSLTVLEPPALDVARGVPAGDAFIRDGEEWWATGPTDDPEAFLRGFLHHVGSDFEPPSPLPPDLEQGARALIYERLPWEARIPLERLAAASFPVLVVSGEHHAAFDAVCDVLEDRLEAERVVLRGYGHNPQRHPDFNDALAGFIDRAAARAAS
jgi:pimeloyl-ACP methyl ester carboxylesterase